MRLSVEISIEQLVRYIKQLPLAEKRRLVSELEKDLSDDQKETRLQKILKNGPTWSEEEYHQFLQTREQLNSLTTS